MNKKIPIYLSAVIVVMMVSGCASMLERAFTPPGHVNFYPGIGANYDILTDEKESASVRLIVGILDIPFSLALDTVLLPFDTYDYFKFKHEDKCATENNQKGKPTSQPKKPVTGTSVDAILKQAIQEP